MGCRPDHKLTISFIDGSTGGYQGIGFVGSPQQIFWSDKYVPEYIRVYILEGINYAIGEANKDHKNQNRWLDDLLRIVPPLIDNIYARMIDIESRLLGDGFKTANPQNSHRYQAEVLKKYLEDAVNERKWSKIEIAYWWVKKYQLILGPLIVALIAYLFKDVFK